MVDKDKGIETLLTPANFMRRGMCMVLTWLEYRGKVDLPD